MRTAQEALSYARRYTTYTPGFCARWVQICFAGPWIGTSAIDAWRRARMKRYTWPPPAGVPVYWSGGRYGHVAISTGGGRCRSTDWPSRGRVSETYISSLSRSWGYRYLGWSADVNGQGIRGIYSGPSQVVYASQTSYGKRNESVRQMQRRLIALGYRIPAGATGYYGEQTKAAVRAIQRAWRQPWPYNTGQSMGPLQLGRLFRGTNVAVRR